VSDKVIAEGKHITIKVSEEIKALVESMFWVLQNRPDNISMSSTNNSYDIYNLDNDKQLSIVVDDKKQKGNV
jgi:hypothetical protein